MCPFPCVTACPSSPRETMDTRSELSIMPNVRHVSTQTMDRMVDWLSHCFFVAIPLLSIVYLLFYKREKEEKKGALKKEYARTMDNGHPFIASAP